MAIASTNPATGAVLNTYEELSDVELERRLVLAERAFSDWRQTTFVERARLMKQLAVELSTRAEDLAGLITAEIGRPITPSTAEIEKCAWVCEYYADQADHILAEEVVATDATRSYVRFDPMGVILAVMPWNFPFWQVMRFAAPALMAGNVAVLKHASNVPQCALAIEAMFLAAGFPKGVFQTLLVGVSRVEKLVQDDRIVAATLTGSEFAGTRLAMHCGAEIKPVVLELGGSDPYIVLADADITQAAAIAVHARLQNAGQSCIAGKRFIVEQSVVEEFSAALVKNFQTIKVGDPTLAETEMGPMASEKLRAEVARQVDESVDQGAVLLTGGSIPEGPGYFYPPTLLRHVKLDMPVCNQEVFGPAAPIIEVKDIDEAIRVANSSRFGLGASVWTCDAEKIERCARELQAGAVFFNGMVKSDPRLPFGGTKKSGLGRELGSYGMKEFVHIKTVWVK